MANDRWCAHVSVLSRDLTIEEFLRDLTPPREGELCTLSSTKRGPNAPHIFDILRRGKSEDGYLLTRALVETGDGAEWGVYIESSGIYPRLLGSTLLEAVGLERYLGRIGVVDGVGTDLSTAQSAFSDFRECAEFWNQSGVCFLLIVNSVGGSRLTLKEVHRLVPEFYLSTVPVQEFTHPDTASAAEEVFGFPFPRGSVTLLSRDDTDTTRKIGSFPLRDKNTSRRLSRAITTESERISALFSSRVSYSEPEMRVTTVASVPEVDVSEFERMKAENERLFRRQRELERDLTAAHRTITALSAAAEETLETPESGADEPVAEESVLSPARALSAERRDTDHGSFRALAEVATDLPHIRFPGSAVRVESIQDDPRARAWRTATWNALLFLNEYAEAVSEGTTRVDLYHFLKEHPDPPVNPRRFVFRESETIRSSTKLMSLRTFEVDGEPVPMEAHFRVDASGRAPAPRMHFAEIDGVIHIGYVGEHLRNTQTN